MELRKLDPGRDAAIVAGLFLRAADYVRMAEGVDPGPPQVASFFRNVPPGGRIEESVKVGLFDGASLLGIADMGFGYPEAGDGYIGLMLFAPEARGRGLGKALLALLEEEARARHAPRLFCGVLQANPRGRAFWMREGFLPSGGAKSIVVGGKRQMAQRMMKVLRRP